LLAEVHRGKVIGVSFHELGHRDGATFLLAHYARHAPPELIVNRLERSQSVARALSATNGYPVEITLPEEGAPRELLAFCERNFVYRTTDERRRTKRAQTNGDGRHLTDDV
jgi:excinuclease UvrABC nuclease subunit